MTHKLTEEPMNTFDPIDPQKKAISFIESVCGLESIEESPNSAARPTDNTPDGTPPSLIVFGDVDAQPSGEKFDSRKTITQAAENEKAVDGSCFSSDEKNKKIELR